MELQEPRLSAFWFKTMTYLLLIMIFLPTTFATSFRNETDRLALLKIKESITTDPLGSLNTWNDSLHFCNWHGISCSARHQRVVALNLSHSDLNGTISPFIGNLSFLRSIDLGNNNLSGEIPQHVDRLFRLRHLNLSFNMLEGRIPVNLTSCPEMSHIDFWSNHLTGTIPTDLGSLVKLVYLNLRQNKLTGGIPPSLGNLSSISLLSLAYNNLVGNIPEEIGRLRSLFLFNIGVNKLSGMIPPSLFNISTMEYFTLVSNKFKGSIPPSIGFNMPNLQELYFGDNELSGQIPLSLSNASQLHALDVGANNLIGQVPKSFGDLSDLVLVDLSDNYLGSFSANDLDFITSLANCSKLEVLEMSNNRLGGVLSNSVGNLSTRLTEVYFQRNHISGVVPETLGNLNNLIALGLGDNLFRGTISTSIAKLQKLQALELYGNRLSGRIPSSLGNLTQLYRLYLFENDLDGTIPLGIGNCQHLQHLDVSHNRLSGDTASQVMGLSSLVNLYLSQNSLTGSLPMEVGNLKNIYDLDISENNLTGAIPEIISKCMSLELLDLHGNHFQGLIPSSLASLKGLQYLDFSQNNLSGQIPKDMQRLAFLLYLNLSFNNLEGEVPKEGIFQNRSAISLVGNTKLCSGDVSVLQLPACIIKRQSKFKLQYTIILVVGCSLVFAALFSLYWRRKMRKKALAGDSSFSFLSKITYRALHQATGGFSPSTLIGSGGFGSVYKGILNQGEQNVVAIKVINLQQRGASKSFTAECNALRNIRHRNLVKILTCCSSMDYNGTEFKALVFEYMSNGSLEDWLHGEEQSMSSTLLQRLNIVVDVASALCYLHDHCQPPIIHCDIKPSNVLLDDDMVARVGDFGLATLISTTTESSQTQSSTIGIKGTIGYAAPEYASGVEASRQGDVYSYGILVLEMFTGRRPTDEMFKDGLKLHDFVKMALPGRLAQIVDPALLAILEETAPAATRNVVNYMLRGRNNEIEADEENNINCGNLSKMNIHVWNCIHSILQIGLACSQEPPKNRMSMKDVVRDLHRIQMAYIDVVIHPERPRR